MRSCVFVLPKARHHRAGELRREGGWREREAERWRVSAGDKQRPAKKEREGKR